MDFDINGILAPVFTPMDDYGCISFSVIPKYMQYLQENKVHGILVGGTTGEAMSLNITERKDILNAWVKVAKPLGVKVICQVGGAPLPDVIELTKHAAIIEADAIMTLPELYYKPKTAEQLVEYLDVVAKAAPSLPLIYYHFPMMTGVDGPEKLFMNVKATTGSENNPVIEKNRQETRSVNMTHFFTLATSRIPNFKGLKADLSVAMQLTNYLTDQVIFIANHHLATSVLMGHDSSIATVTNLFPALVHDIVQSVKRSDVHRARKLQEKLNNLVEAITRNGEFIPTMKAAMEIVTGIKVGPPRQPIKSLDEEQRKKVEECLRNMEINTRSE